MLDGKLVCIVYYPSKVITSLYYYIELWSSTPLIDRVTIVLKLHNWHRCGFDNNFLLLRIQKLILPLCNWVDNEKKNLDGQNISLSAWIIFTLTDLTFNTNRSYSHMNHLDSIQSDHRFALSCRCAHAMMICIITIWEFIPNISLSSLSLPFLGWSRPLSLYNINNNRRRNPKCLPHWALLAQTL